jgi:serine/threonine-protein kinase RsbT
MLPIQINVTDEVHAIVASQRGRALARELGLNLVEQTALSTAILEIASNIVKYAGHGSMAITPVSDQYGRGVEVIARDTGPGIVDIALAMKDGYSTGKSLGLGLPGAKRLMNTFEIESTPGKGTQIIMRKYHRER